MAAKVVLTRSFFFINEKSFGSIYRSRLVIVCDGGAHQIVDLQCSNNNKAHNLVQDGTFLALENVPWLSAGDRMFVGTFRSADTVTDESGDSAICVKKLSDIASSSPVNATKVLGAFQYEERHTYSLTGSTAKGHTPMVSLKERRTSCTGSGTSPVTMTPVYTWTSDQGYITTVTGHMMTSTNTAVIQFGTSKGRLIQTSLQSFGDNLELFADLLVQEGVPVVAIYTPDVSSGVTYVVTRNKIAAYVQANCALYNTCKETMERKNPYCGWCVFEGRSTIESSCTSGDWRSVISPCVSLNVSQRGQEAATSATVTVTASNFTKIGSERFQCKIMGEVIPATVNGLSFTCTIPPANGHTLTTLTLEGVKDNGEEYIVGSSPYWFYKCAQFKRCGECTGTAGVQCQWCSARCQNSCPSHGSRKKRSEVASECPKVTGSIPRFLPNDVEKNVAFDVNIPASETLFGFTCSIKGATNTKSFTGVFGNDKVFCDMMLRIPEYESKRDFDVTIQYGPPESLVEIDGNITVTVYRPEMLAIDCTHCKFLNKTRYQCDWTGSRCVYNAAGFINTVECPGAALTQITPSDGNNRGRTLVTIYGSDMVGSDSSSVSVSLGGSRCSDSRVLDVSKQPEFEHTIIDSVKCKTGSHTSPDDAAVEVTIGGKAASSNIVFFYKVPEILTITPAKGITAGGVIVTFIGTNLASGNKKVDIRYNRARSLGNCSVTSLSTITCIMSEGINSKLYTIGVSFDWETSWHDGGTYTFTDINYDVLENPTITNISSVRTVFSGGLFITIYGDNFGNAANHKLTAYYNGIEKTRECEKRNSTNTEIRCMSPPAPPNLKTDLEDKLNQNKRYRRKRSATCPCIEVRMKIQMDGFEKEFIVSYYPDPLFDITSNSKHLEIEEGYITLTASYLDLVAVVEDFIVHIGEGLCTELVLTNTRLTCKVPTHLPDGSRHRVTVSVGNVFVFLGYVQYGMVNTKDDIMKIVGVGIGGTVLIALIVFSLVFGKYQLLKMRKRTFEKKLDVTEMEIRLTSRQEFADVVNGMLLVNKKLKNQRPPFHSYQQYAFNVLFSADQVLVDQAGTMRSPTKLALDSLEKLILNKFFLISLVRTMEKQKRFFKKESVLQELLMELAKDAVARKQQNSLFIRCETITESLLNNWLALTLYPHFRSSSGSPLYLLYMAMQLTMESGPIDAITGDAKYTLLEDRLLRSWESTKRGETGVQVEAKSLTLKIGVDIVDRVYDCKVLDCDTITQVKAKCLRQIYVNYCASKLGVDPMELLLNWRAEHMTLRDEDNTSRVEGNLLRYNTLDHCNVRDQAIMALHDPNSLDQGHYISLGDIDLERQDRGADHDTSKLLNSRDVNEETPADLFRWHLVKPGSKDMEPSKEADMHRLFTTKQSIQQYITALFDNILDSAHCPPPAKFICDYMDILAGTFKIDEQTLKAWKSQSYAAGIWGQLIRNPSQLVDVVVPTYVEESLGVVAQVFDDCLATQSPKFTEDTSAYKLVFHNETTLYRDKVRLFLKGLQIKGEQTEVLQQYLSDLSRFQQEQQSFNKMAYLQKLYDQMRPYLEEIVENLSLNREAHNLGLDRKLQDVIDMIEK